MSWTIEDFRATSLEVGQWCWGTLEGAFNEKQTISQIIVDAVIGMIPLVGDATAVRDLLAVSIGMSQDPVKRNDTTQRVLLVVLIFALIPVVGGVIKGVGRLLLKVTGDVAKDAELLKAVVQFLNRMGHGDAPKWLKALDLAKYQAQVVTRLKDFCATVRVAIQRSLAARVGRMLPDKWRAALERVSSGFHAIQDMADQIVPEAIKELNAKLKVLQNMVYRGEVHEIATGGAPKLEREVEAYLQERRLARDIRRGRFPSADCLADGGKVEALLKARYGPKIAEGWPDILAKKGKMPMFGGDKVFTDVASFSGEIKALTAKELAGKKVYRVFGNPSELATYPGGSSAGGRRPAFWGVGEPPKTAEEWRRLCAVLDVWNGNGFIVVLQLPHDFGERLPAAKAWAGKVAEQYGVVTPVQYLEGGADQLVVDFGKLSEYVTEEGEKIKHQFANFTGHADLHVQREFDGVKIEFHKTNWENVEKVYGYSKYEDDIKYSTKTRRLASDEIQTKVTNSRVTAAMRSAANNEGQR
ncbi:hypothetical protein [Burkholderia multivorans]|uniref:Uncharacterized protein n=1 Tax=Burkholderia multivorans TaxID=87883 RepID=A0AB37AJA2_9BURK|nr:hypothetical protein [Burkholderia multivorans]EED97928.1 conserved hypothetical protein [Burkholderia multivorans CGD1]MBU9310383.1 hypothetical protein [Burkholderia multivorans]MDN7953543.1 hypothetical protein [Burkholderia multivorans]MDR9240639.1 hypothetical protein [Burkholderia multivorans]MDR9267865.1 hypothetical protein [Burkholderia multivorans]